MSKSAVINEWVFEDINGSSIVLWDKASFAEAEECLPEGEWNLISTYSYSRIHD